MSERKRSRVCGTCKAHEPTGAYLNNVELVECRRRAPYPGDKSIRGQLAYWPLKKADEWCMEYCQA